MTAIKIPISDEIYEEMEHFSWVKWSEIARNFLRKRAIFEKFVRYDELSGEDVDFCDEINWHPADELYLKGEFVQKLKDSKNENSIKVKNIFDIFE
ncbi:MAG: hypothetical protein ACPK85_12100 [Methanosarcina sp.]